ncbi:phosphinothricin N-acetyltransferase, putative [Thioalkalivibrio nitratireducens DSM 14787]|uniref:Phosphinothricin N-acetyltransferase, putative n=1 Tax=Thioalkalivibrio nitratireducens (strain DSM 14787 / UNIQEM 213 / ALEN2) TaxID=1255043 RepID=L0DV16_THIND|nr:GNAT family N-acetyltransferase [Thioalkalivibrio nitratireducens]AGA32835.1 phosphinothricin N-acetyltransferase, putative [Thioalkalivibrio nitratireducens DSM 14787]
MASNAIIRHAHRGDAEAVAAIWNPQIRDTVFTFDHHEYPVEEVARMIDARETAGLVWLVAEEDGAVTGFATYAPFRDGEGYARTMEHTIFLDPEAAGDGLGELLMDALVNEGRARGVHSLIACVTGENEVGLKFHRDQGFEVVGSISEAGRKSGRWMDLRILQRRL